MPKRGLDDPLIYEEAKAAPSETALQMSLF
jgi:hypothetical protein